jgi:catechol 2,3-dioxygenase-like lactoylglutathione lyase family enzyme
MNEIVEVALFTKDVPEVARFYRALVGAAPVEEWSGGTTYQAGSVALLIHERSDAPGAGPANEDHFALAVADLDATCEKLRGRGIAFLVEPRDYPWGRSAYLRDPDGRVVELSQR